MDWSVGDEVGATRRLRLQPALVALIPLALVSLVLFVLLVPCVSFVTPNVSLPPLVSFVPPPSQSQSEGLGVGDAVGYLETSLLRVVFNDCECCVEITTVWVFLGSTDP